jgi:hypothetical protein
MALILTRRINQGVHVEGRGDSLDLIVSKIRGDHVWCEAEIEVRSSNESRFLQISTDSSPVSVLDNFKIGLMGKRGRYAVSIAYTANWDYQIQRRDYEI